MADLATAYVRLIPSLRGAQGTIEKELGGAADSAGKSAGGKAGEGILGGLRSKLGGGMKGVAGMMGKALVAGGAAAATSVGAVGKAALDSYAEYEQLAGGAKLAFGDAYGYIEQRSKDAYKNVQMSQNDYLQQVNGLAVGLREAMGGDSAGAAQLADKVVTAQADIVSAMGITQESAQNAFNGIMKGNFTMLDNLQLGIKPTKEGMQEVIDKVNDWRVSQGQAGDLTIDNLADCQAAVVDYVQMMGYAGYAGKEGMTTVEGSINATKSAWQNLLTEFGKDDGNVAARATELASAATTALLGATDENGNQLSTGIMGRIRTIMAQVQAAIPTVVPMVAQTLATVVPQLVAVVGPTALTLLTTVINLITANIPNMMGAAISLFGTIAQAITAHGPTILAAIGNLLVTLVMTLVANVPNLLSAGLQLFQAIGQAIDQALPQIMATAQAMLQDIWDKVSSFDLAGAAADLISGLVSGIAANVGRVKDALLGGIKGAVDGALSFLGIASPSKLFAWVGEMNMEGLAQGTDSGVRMAERSMADAVRDVYAASLPRSAAAPQAAAAQPVDGGAYAATQALRNDLANMGIYLDGNALVGGIRTRMDRALVR